MEATKVSISDKTLLSAPTLTGKRKRELRIKVLKEYIAECKYGERVKMGDLQKLLHFNTSANAWTFIEKLVKRGIIVKHEITPRTFFYTVAGEVHVTSPRVVEKAIDLGQAIEQHKQRDVIIGRKQYSIDDLNTEAMKYYWAYDDTTIKGFINWLKSQEG